MFSLGEIITICSKNRAGEIMKQIEITIEAEVVKPDSPEQITKLLKEAIYESITKSGLDKVVPPQQINISFPQYLPTGEDLQKWQFVICVLQVAVPMLKPAIKSFFQYLKTNAKFKRATAGKLKVEVSVGDKKLKVENLEATDALDAVINGIKINITPQKGD